MLTKIFLKTKLVHIGYMYANKQLLTPKKGMDYYRLFSRKLVWFGIIWISHAKIDLWHIFFPLNYCYNTQIFNQNWKMKKHMDFWNSPCLSFTKRVVNFKNLHFLIFFNSDLKFVFYGKNWVGKMCHKSIFGCDTQIIPNQTSLRKNNR